MVSGPKYHLHPEVGLERANLSLTSKRHSIIEEIRVRREAVQALGLIGGPKAIGLLVRALTDNDVRIRCMAAVNLGKVGKKTGLITSGAIQGFL